MGVMEDRRRIIAAQPHLTTASGNNIQLAIAEPKVERLKVYYHPVQSGSGTPSPSNIRTIVPWTDLPVSIGNTTYHAQLNGSYAGYVDLITGDGLATWNYTAPSWTDASQFSSFTKSGDNRIFWIYLGGAVYNTEEIHILSDQYTFAGYGYNYAGVPVYSMCGSPDYTGSLWLKVPASVLPTDNIAGAQAYFQQTLPKFSWPRTVAGRSTYHITPVSVAAPRGNQTITTPADSVEIDYWTK